MRQNIGKALVLTAFFWSVTITAITIVWAQSASRPAPSPWSQPSPSAASNATAQKSSDYGVWHHFGETAGAPPAEPAQSSGWRHFGNGGNPSPSPSPSPLPSPRNPEVYRPREPGVSGNRQMEAWMYELVNRDRADPGNLAETKGKALPLRWNEQVAAVARAHSLDMLTQGYFSHEDRSGGSVATRVEAAGLEWQAVGENIAIISTVGDGEAAFTDEPRFAKNHRGNILNANFTEVGIGIVQGPDGRLYITQDFYTPPSRVTAPARAD